MRRIFYIIALTLTLISCNGRAQNPQISVSNLPDSVVVYGDKMHVQGIAVDPVEKCMYMSFTSKFVKVDFRGNILASIDRIQGHLGDMVFNRDDRKVYASLECKDDVIGKGVARGLGVAEIPEGQSAFYVAIIDVTRLNRVGMDPEKDDVLRTSYLKAVVEDYNYEKDGVKHRFACAGMDGMTIAPKIGKRNGKNMLYVAYGIYGDNSRDDNDSQILAEYDLAELNANSEKIKFGEFHKTGPESYKARYFIHTGNTTWGVQNLAYDAHTGYLFMAVYPGKKPQYPNYKLFAAPVAQKPVKIGKREFMLELAEAGMTHQATGIRGWYFPYGSTGFSPLGNGLYYISRNGKTADGKQFCNAKLYHWNGSPETPFD